MIMTARKKVTAAVAALGLLALVPLLTGALSSNSWVTAQTPKAAVVQFLMGTDTAGTYKTLYTCGSNGSKIISMYLTSNDPTGHLITIQYKSSTVFYGGMAITTGTNLPGFATGVPALAPMSSSNWPGLPVDPYGNPYLFCNSGDTIQATYATNGTSSDVVNIVAVVADF